MKMYKDEATTNYLRRKNFENMRNELLFYKNEMKAEYLYFWADTFFSWSKNEFEKFCELYADINLPFWCQTRVETVTKERFDKLKYIGCDRISFGLEHGNAQYRNKYLNRLMTNEKITEGLKLVKEIGIPFSVNNILGFPHETRKLAFDTIKLNRTFEADDRNAYPFTPFTGTPLREVCEKLGFVKKTDIVRSMVANGSILNMPQFSREEVNGLCKTFNMYVKFPENRWPEIEKAEGDSKESQIIYNSLKDEFIDKFWSNDVSFENSAKETLPEQFL
jgi:anaerobic magnesium-protoporphyrin IX monomethyl ester cyclase